MDEMKGDSPFRHSLASCEPTLDSGLMVRGERCLPIHHGEANNLEDDISPIKSKI